MMDVYYTLIPVYVLSKILGLAPFYLTYKKNDNPNNRHRYFVSSVGIIIVIRFIAVIGSMIYVAFLMDELKLQYDLRGVALRCELLTGFILTSTMLIGAVINRKLLISAVEDINNIDKVMEENGIPLSYINARRFSAFQITGISCVFISKAIIQPFTAEQAFVSIYNIFNIVDYINTITLFQYIDLILLLRQRYIWFNRKLKYLGIQIISNSPAEKQRIPTKIISSIIKVNPIKSNNPKIFKSSLNEADLDKELNIMSKIHNDLYQVATKINEVYSFRLLLTIGMRFVMITTQLLTVYKMIFGRGLKSKFLTYILIGIYLFLHTSKVFMISSVSSNVADKAKQTGNLLHSIWNSRFRIKQNINCFSLQILQQNLCFDASGFFILNYGLLYNITAALTVYLIILIQFDSTSPILDSNTNCTALNTSQVNQ